mmetsp:Transcript_48956/g.116571  ORF Transcript_48956/g.116571 Transcript_48956/m.116571 type:complete len:390 (-) Transcript_48956:2964-4133(-)
MRPRGTADASTAFTSFWKSWRPGGTQTGVERALMRARAAESCCWVLRSCGCASGAGHTFSRAFLSSACTSLSLPGNTIHSSGVYLARRARKRRRSDRSRIGLVWLRHFSSAHASALERTVASPLSILRRSIISAGEVEVPPPPFFIRCSILHTSPGVAGVFRTASSNAATPAASMAGGPARALNRVARAAGCASPASASSALRVASRPRSCSTSSRAAVRSAAGTMDESFFASAATSASRDLRSRFATSSCCSSAFSRAEAATSRSVGTIPPFSSMTKCSSLRTRASSSLAFATVASASARATSPAARASCACFIRPLASSTSARGRSSAPCAFSCSNAAVASEQRASALPRAWFAASSFSFNARSSVCATRSSALMLVTTWVARELAR